MVFVPADGDIDDRYVPHQITCVTAYRLDGNGALEIVCVMKKKFCVLDGKTGACKKQYDLPGEEAHDCIILADLTGRGARRDVILKELYFRMWALNNKEKVYVYSEGIKESGQNTVDMIKIQLA